MIRVPSQLLEKPYNQRSIRLNECTVVESCTHEVASEGSMFLAEHMFIFVLEGRFILQASNQQILIDRNEGAIIKKMHVVEYQKIGYLREKPYESIMFFLQDNYLKDFIRISGIKQKQKIEHEVAIKISVDDKLLGFIESIKPYFNESSFDQPGLLKLKIMELLYNLSVSNTALFPHLLELSTPVEQNIVEIMENNFKSPLKLEDFAYLSGRSLSSFKRDFLKIYGIPPARWIAKKKLDYARNLLRSTDMAVGGVCNEAGFMSLAHFSRLFKQHFGISPSQAKVDLHSQQI
ncbi:MAG: helix-turn-helix transcriptional regulator [Anaerolineae bacterium]|nr:helix-turn-helix transcriptional regulator [Gloeobacterales cyanobacterium ES-bin-313]